jgi:hypothetical protein
MTMDSMAIDVAVVFHKLNAWTTDSSGLDPVNNILNNMAEYGTFMEYLCLLAILDQSDVDELDDVFSLVDDLACDIFQALEKVKYFYAVQEDPRFKERMG